MTLGDFLCQKYKKISDLSRICWHCFWVKSEVHQMLIGTTLHSTTQAAKLTRMLAM
jgi:hypothetical protein